FLLCLGWISIADSRIAGPPVRYLIGDIPAGSFFKGLNYIKDAVALAGAQVIGYYPRTFRQFLERFEVTNSQIHHVDIIAYAGTLRDSIFDTKGRQLYQFSNGYLGDIMH